jgi:hypothetical protein
MPLSRRSLLGIGLGGSVLLALGGVGLALRPGASVPLPDGLRVLDARRYATLWHLAERMCPGGGLFPAASALGVAAAVDTQLVRMPAGDVAELLQALDLLENALTGVLVGGGRTAAFSASAPADQERTLDTWRTSRIHVLRGAYKAWHGLVSAAYYGNPLVYAAVGYPGPPAWLLVAARATAPPPPDPAAAVDADPAAVVLP